MWLQDFFGLALSSCTTLARRCDRFFAVRAGGLGILVNLVSWLYSNGKETSISFNFQSKAQQTSQRNNIGFLTKLTHLSPGTNVIKKITAISYDFHNRPERLSLASKPFQTS